MEITVQDLHRGMPLLLRWGGKSPYPEIAGELSEYALNPGWKVPEQMDHFFTRIDETTSIMKDARIIPMNTLDLDIDYLRTDFELNDIRALQGYAPDAQRVPGEQIQDIYEFEESNPYFHRHSLHAVRTVAFTEVPKTFLDENLESENFLFTVAPLYMNQLGMEIEKQGLFGIKNPARPNGRSSMDSLDGIFQQLRVIDGEYETGTDNPQGFGSAFSPANGSIIKQFMDKISEYINQNGNTKGAKFYVSKVLYYQLLQEVTTRETEWGDHVIRNGENMTIFDIPIVNVDCLNPRSNPRKRNYWNHVALLGQPQSMTWGIYKGIESETSKQHNKLNYLTSWEASFDTLILWEQDVLGFDVVDGAVGGFSIKVIDSTKEGVAGATVEIYDPTSDNPDEAIQTDTTEANGVVTFDGLAYGKYTIKVTANTYKDETVDGVILNEAEEVEVIKLRKA